jgi:hypothetical protein
VIKLQGKCIVFLSKGGMKGITKQLVGGKVCGGGFMGACHWFSFRLFKIEYIYQDVLVYRIQ